MRKISMTALRKAYPNPVRPLTSSGEDYCVGGALCQKVGWATVYFPNEQQLKDAVLLANKEIGKYWYELKDKQRDEIYSLVRGVLEANDIGAFDTSWKLLGTLLRMKPSFAEVQK